MKHLVLIATLLFAIGATASSGPIKITGDKFVIDDSAHTATFSGKVVVLREGLSVWAAKVVVDYGAGGPSDIHSFIATGGVRIKSTGQEATGDRAVYDPNAQKLRLTGNVIVVNATGTVGSPELVVDLLTNKSTFSGSGSGGRVTGVFTPK